MYSCEYVSTESSRTALLKGNGITPSQYETAMSPVNVAGSTMNMILINEFVDKGAIPISIPTGRRITPNIISINIITFHIRIVSVTLLPILKEQH